MFFKVGRGVAPIDKVTVGVVLMWQKNGAKITIHASKVTHMDPANALIALCSAVFYHIRIEGSTGGGGRLAVK